MAVPILGKTSIDPRRAKEQKFYFPFMLTSPAMPQAGDSYLSDIRLKDIEIQALYMEKGRMDENPGWDGSPYDWSKDVTEIQSDFVDLGSISGGKPNILFSTDLSNKEWGRWVPSSWELDKKPSEWFYSNIEPSDRSKIWVNTKDKDNIPKYWNGKSWSSYFERVLSLSKATVKIIEQESGNSFEVTTNETGYFSGVSQFVRLNVGKLEDNNFKINASVEIEEAPKSSGVTIQIDYYNTEGNHLKEEISPRFFNKTTGKKISKDFVFSAPRETKYIMYSLLGVENGYVRVSMNHAKAEYGNRYTSWTLHETESALNLNAGEISLPMLGGQPDKSRIISEIAVLRSALGTNLLEWEEVTRIRASSMKQAIYYDYFVENGNYYRYAIQPILANRTKDVITSFYDTVTTMEGFWMLGQDDLQFSFIYNGNIAEITHVGKDEIVETIASQYPYIVKSSDIDYRRFEFTGMFTHHQDVHGHFVAGTYTEAVSPLPTLPINYVEIKYGDEMLLNCQNDLEEEQDGMVMQRLWREKILKWMKNGKPKILKSEAEGNILVHIYNPVVRPIKTVYGLVQEFSCQMVEIGPVNEETIKKFKLRKEILNKDDLMKASQNERGFHPYRNIKI